jgi:hypothetical protein
MSALAHTGSNHLEQLQASGSRVAFSAFIILSQSNVMHVTDTQHPGPGSCSGASKALVGGVIRMMRLSASRVIGFALLFRCKQQALRLTVSELVLVRNRRVEVLGHV